MIKRLMMTNVGPAPKMELEFGSRLNLLTGDNGLGKSFLLDIVWWAMACSWPAEINPGLTAGKKALPANDGEAKISFSIFGDKKEHDFRYIRKEQRWVDKQKGRPGNPGLVLYAMSDGSFAVWDPYRNYLPVHNAINLQKSPQAYVFSPAEVWDGLTGRRSSWLCNGLLRDWASWQKENGPSFKYLKEVLKVLSPSETEVLLPGELTRISIDDVRDIPTVRMPYGQDVAVLHASSGMRRIMALAYFLVWAWQEHKQAAKQLGEPATKQIAFLIDEIESHLHPSWQRCIIPTLMGVMGKLSSNAKVQLITATHSPLIMASVEPLFEEEKDAWFDLDLVNNQVALTRRPFVRQGDVRSWLTSEAFDMKSGYSIEAEKVLEEATQALSNEAFSSDDARALDQRLREVLSETDPFWMRWRFVAEKKGWMS